MKDILKHHIAAHPSITAQDMIKLCYQATFGAEHLLTNVTQVKAYFEQEWQRTEARDIPLTEPLSDNYIRIYLDAWKHQGLPADWLFQMFYLTASAHDNASAQDLTERLNNVTRLAAEGDMPFSAEIWQKTCQEYLQSGGGAVHHSEEYRIAELPSYRVVHSRYQYLIPLLIQLKNIHPQPNHAAVIAIDGRAASGKSTLAELLADILRAGVVHMDDFFLPNELRTPDRLATPGGNVHYERFEEQVLPHLKNNESFTYPVFNCSKMQLDGVRNVPSSPWRIVEGSYSHHPKLNQYMDIRVFCTVSLEEQMRRILSRNGESMAKLFAQRWIPMEENYFDTYQICQNSDMIIQTENEGVI